MINTASTKVLHNKLTVVICLLFISLFHGANGQLKNESTHEKPFRSGEKLTYNVKFGPITGGSATLELKMEFYKNRRVYHAIGEGKTVGLAEKLYSVKDVFESYFDPGSILPHKSVRDVKEGNYRKHEEAIFNQIKNTVYVSRKDTEVMVPPNILDMVSLLYYLRTLDLDNLKAGSEIRTITFFDEELFPFNIRYKGKEVVKTKYGKIRCFRFDPVVEPGRMFKSEDDMTIWISDDGNFIPVKVRFELWVGSLRMELADYVNLKYPLGIIPK